MPRNYSRSSSMPSYRRSSSTRSIESLSSFKTRGTSPQTGTGNFNLKAIRTFLYLTGLLSLVIVLFMAQRLESRYGSGIYVSLLNVSLANDFVASIVVVVGCPNDLLTIFSHRLHSQRPKLTPAAGGQTLYSRCRLPQIKELRVR